MLTAVTEDILSPTSMATAIEVVARELAIPYEEQRSRLELIRLELIKLETKQDRVMTAYEAGAYTVEDFMQEDGAPAEAESRA